MFKYLILSLLPLLLATGREPLGLRLSLPVVLVVIGRGEILELVSSFLVLQLPKRLRLDLADAFPGNTHHLTNFFECEGTVIAGNPGAVAEHVVLEPPLADRIRARLGNQNRLFLAFIHARDRLLWKVATIVMSILILSTLKDLFTSLFSWQTLTNGAMRPLSGSIRLYKCAESLMAGMASSLVAHVALIMERSRRFFDVH